MLQIKGDYIIDLEIGTIFLDCLAFISTLRKNMLYFRTESNLKGFGVIIGNSTEVLSGLQMFNQLIKEFLLSVDQ